MSDITVTSYQDVTNTRTKSKASLTEDSAWYADELAPVIGGIGGHIAPPTGHGCVEDVTIQEQGTVSNIMPFTGTDLMEQIPDTYLYVRECRFTNRLSMGTVSMAEKIRKYDPEVLSPLLAKYTGRSGADGVRYVALHSTQYGSTLYTLMRDFLKRSIIVRSDANYIKMILLEAMHLYMELWKLRSGQTFTSDLTSLDMCNSLRNIEGVIQYFTLKNVQRTGMDRFDLVHELRRIEKVTLQAKTDVIDYL